jgi:hypothetical protein
MSDTYTVAVFKDETSYSMTVRCLARNKHFKYNAGNPNCIYDSTQSNPKMFTILFEGSQTEAEKFAHVISAAYSLVGVTRGLVKTERTDNE